jgi:hypothetical protein
MSEGALTLELRQGRRDGGVAEPACNDARRRPCIADGRARANKVRPRGRVYQGCCDRVGVSVASKGAIVTGHTIIQAMRQGLGISNVCESQSDFVTSSESPETLHSVFHGLMHGGFRPRVSC